MQRVFIFLSQIERGVQKLYVTKIHRFITFFLTNIEVNSPIHATVEIVENYFLNDQYKLL